jgi:CxxC-x17-CxxC domain-containing protein
MDRRDRDNKKPAPRGPRPHARRNGAPQPPALASYEDPNVYRSPGFQDVTQTPYRIDYDGLPRDDDDDLDNLAPALPSTPLTSHGLREPRGMGGRRRDRTGTDPLAYRSPAFRDERGKSRHIGFAYGNNGNALHRSAPGNGHPRGHGGAGPTPDPPHDRSTTPAVSSQGERASAPRERRNARPKFETTCKECGAAAVVPFEPGPDRPAFCKPCYEVKKHELGLGPGKRPQLAPSSS